jgi:hypothetical protein
MQFAPLPCYPFSLSLKYLYRHPISYTLRRTKDTIWKTHNVTLGICRRVDWQIRAKVSRKTTLPFWVPCIVSPPYDLLTCPESRPSLNVTI